MRRRKKLIISILLVILIGMVVLTLDLLFLGVNSEVAGGNGNILVCAIDESEKRPGMGGCDMAFIVELKNSTLVNYKAIYPGGLTHPTEPEPAEAQTQGAGSKLLLHDSFWYEDNEKSMQNAKEIVEYHTGEKIDAVVAINTEALDAIIKEASPLELNGETVHNVSGIEFIRDEQDADGVSRGSAVMDIAEAVARSAQDPAKKSAMIDAAIDQYTKGNIVMSPAGGFVKLLASKGIEQLFS